MIVTIAEVLDKVIVPQDVLIRTSVLMVVGCAVAFCLSRWRIRSLILLIVAIGALGLIDQVVLNHFNDADIYQAIISEYGNAYEFHMAMAHHLPVVFFGGVALLVAYLQGRRSLRCASSM